MGKECTGYQIGAPQFYLFLHAGPGAGIFDFDTDTDFPGQHLHQIGVGADQPIFIIRITPKVGRIFGITGCYQVFAGAIISGGGAGRNQPK
ncbi:hypothetical protein GCM10011396_22890 [Undibacterium terreum]|uniref:Uncharacterized protein n=1 Tax=Undibacterium terreum TaxID=1224302 RepID=A0A916UJC0_9BURK|nr:hypothetical protein GCM10011396_22890 [Undibacterium terreum]